MAKIAALGAYFYQSLLAFGLLIAVSNLLPASDFAAYSLFISIVQFAEIACFQWIRAASSRFYPGPDDASERTERSVIMAELAGSAGLCLLGAFLAPLFGAPVWLGLLGAISALLQGAGETHLTMLRFRQEFRLFSQLQGARATILAVATIASAAISPDFAHVVAGFLVGNVIYSILAWVRSRRIMPISVHWQASIVKRNLVYGGTTAGAGVATLLMPLALKTVLLSSLGNAAAGPMLALDLLQRPFIMITSSLQAIRYPELVALFDRKGDPRAMQEELGRYYALLVGLSLIGAASVIAVLGLATQIVIPVGLREAFLRTAPLVMLMAMLRAIAQTVLPTPAHLQRRLPIIVGLAALDCVLTCAGALTAAWVFAGTDTAIVAGAAAGAAAALVLGWFLLRRGSFALPWPPIVLAGAALALSWLCTIWFAGNLMLATGAALASALALSAYPLLVLVRWIAR